MHIPLLYGIVQRQVFCMCTSLESCCTNRRSTSREGFSRADRRLSIVQIVEVPLSREGRGDYPTVGVSAPQAVIGW